MPEVPSRRVADSVLAMIAERQRDQHEENRDANEANRALLEEVRNIMQKMQLDVALVTRDVHELKDWRRMIVDPFLVRLNSGIEQARGGGKVIRWIWPTIATISLALAGWALKLLSVVAVAPK